MLSEKVHGGEKTKFIRLADVKKEHFVVLLLLVVVLWKCGVQWFVIENFFFFFGYKWQKPDNSQNRLTHIIEQLQQ